MLTIGTRDLRGLPLLQRKGFLRDSFEDTSTLGVTNGIVDASENISLKRCSALAFTGANA
jgi:hypothetical protein